jgi:hypothetical protein
VVRTVLAEARGRFSGIFDADLEYDPNDLADLLQPLLRGNSRAFDGYTSHSFLYVLGNRGVTLATNVLFNVYIKNLMTCHKVIDTEVFRALPLRAKGLWTACAWCGRCCGAASAGASGRARRATASARGGDAASDR